MNSSKFNKNALVCKINPAVKIKNVNKETSGENRAIDAHIRKDF